MVRSETMNQSLTEPLSKIGIQDIDLGLGEYEHLDTVRRQSTEEFRPSHAHASYCVVPDPIGVPESLSAFHDP